MHKRLNHTAFRNYGILAAYLDHVPIGKIIHDVLKGIICLPQQQKDDASAVSLASLSDRIVMGAFLGRYERIHGFWPVSEAASKWLQVWA